MNKIRAVRARTLFRIISLSSSASSSRTFSSSTTTTATTTATIPVPATFSIKNVTKSNFEPSLEDLTRHVRASDFVAIDLEMTGIKSAPWRESFQFDRFDVRYLKVKDSAEKFAVIQFGVCPFRWDSSKQSFVAHPFNFYVFPRKELAGDSSSYEFLCQTSSIDFLARYQFDFNVCIHEGISYLSRGQEDEIVRRLVYSFEDEFSDSNSIPKDEDKPLVSMADVLFTERMKNRLKEWCDGLVRETNGGPQLNAFSNHSKQQFETIFFKMRPALALNGFTSRQLRLIQLVMKKHFKDLACVRSNCEDSNSQRLIVYTDSKDDKESLMKEVKAGHHQEARRKVKVAVGFRHVVDLLASEQKLIVGHNCFLDIAHIYSKFLGRLPSTAGEFAASIHKFFPNLIDTKMLLNSNNILNLMMKKNGSSLSKAFALLCPQIVSNFKNSVLPLKPRVKVEVQVDDMSSFTWNSGAKHEAGYDAFMTGCIFAQSCSHLGINFEDHQPPSNLADSEKLQKHINHLYLCWNNGDIINLSTGLKVTDSVNSYMNTKRYSKVLFSNTILLWGFTSNLKAADIRALISKVYGATSVTYVYHLDKTAVFVQFSKADLVAEFLTLKDSLENGNGPILVLHPLSTLLEGGNTRAASYETYREICSSPISKVLFADQAEAMGIRWKTKLVESKEDECSVSGEENRSDFFFTDSSDKKGTDDPSWSTFSCHDLISSFYSNKSSRNTKQIRAETL